MADQPGFLGEGLTADVTDVWLLAGMYQYMLLLRGLPGEGLAADWTGERPDTLMNSQMKIQIPLLSKSLAAGRTHDLLLTFMPNQVLVQILLRSQTALAYLALVSRFIMSILHVRLDSGYILAGVSADTADDGWLAAMYLIHVLLQIVLDLELFLTNRARVLKAAGVLSYKMILQGAFVVALVFAYTTWVQKRSVNLLDVAFQVPFQTETLATGLALILMLTHMFYHNRFLTETFAASGTLQRELRFRFLPVDSVLTDALSSRILSRTMVFLLRCATRLFSLRNVTFVSA